MTFSAMENPRTDREWQDAVDAAKAAIAFDAASHYGLVEGGPEVNVPRCREIMKLGKKRGIEPSADCIERLVAGLMKGRAG